MLSNLFLRMHSQNQITKGTSTETCYDDGLYSNRVTKHCLCCFYVIVSPNFRSASPVCDAENQERINRNWSQSFYKDVYAIV